MSNPHAAPLPASPDLAQQRKRAKELVKSVRAGDEKALARLRYGHPRLVNAPDAELRSAKLHDAQWVIAREYGFSSWIKLKRHIDEITGANRRPYRLFEIDLEYYRGRAAGLRSVLQTGDRNALRLVREFHPRYASATDAEIEAANITQEDAELIQAREHGFSAWGELVAAVEALNADSSREPESRSAGDGTRGENRLRALAGRSHRRDLRGCPGAQAPPQRANCAARQPRRDEP